MSFHLPDPMWRAFCITSRKKETSHPAEKRTFIKQDVNTDQRKQNAGRHGDVPPHPEE